MLWVIFAGFVFLLLYPLLRRVTKERRRIAELMSQLPLELDVEKLVSRALLNAPAPGNGAAGNSAAPGSGAGGPLARTTSDEAGVDGGGTTEASHKEATSKWKAIIRQTTVAGMSSMSDPKRPQQAGR
ncbi:hypothetical protein HYH03_007273 [Edaphochlamys debaryana]|uniref:Uncharacterized protein n=1 Tax=Edaphochlamys debaryana TaxID=47281 RepID=A0A835Y245_9CHLO|nr:hypothetical protein HYH03_007273 [Edaphochlamys debaryana]|eukprot:KAG2494505.1 hypothetical protein HYH03_007273 [Edaphochlamys debaryana]